MLVPAMPLGHGQVFCSLISYLLQMHIAKTQQYHARQSLNTCELVVTGGLPASSEDKRKEKTKLLSMIQEKLMVNLSFPLA